MKNAGFTLIELSIVLVIIGLIVGGILTGRDLIKAAETRAQVAQIEKYNSAVNTFRNKYGGLPGDLTLSLVSQFGFTAGAGCDGTTGNRDGDGIIGAGSVLQAENEPALFWQDLSSINLIENEFPSVGSAAIQCGTTAVLSLSPGASYIGNYFPTAKMGYGQFVYVYSSGGINWFGVAGITSTAAVGNLLSTASMPVIEAFNIDKKMDDGLPTSGAVVAKYLNNLTLGAAPNSTTDTATSCYNTTGTGSYSVSATTNNGNALNCAISFKFE